MPAAAETPRTAVALRSAIDELQRDRIVEALERTGGNQAKAADRVGLPLRTFVKRLTHYGLTKPRKKG